MDETRRSRIRNAGLAGGIATAVAASICCIGPIVAATFGVTALGALVKYESLRPLFGGISVALLAIAFALTYRRRDAAAECEPGSVCDVHGVDRVRRLNQTVLWIAAIVIVSVLTFPTWSNWIFG